MNKILIAEDEPSIREMVRLCLKKNGYSCRVAENGMQAADDRQVLEQVVRDGGERDAGRHQDGEQPL